MTKYAPYVELQIIWYTLVTLLLISSLIIGITFNAIIGMIIIIVPMILGLYLVKTYDSKEIPE